MAANQVILADSWWAPAIEDQAVDRVYRLGQTRETSGFRLVVEGRVLGIQEEKRISLVLVLMVVEFCKGCLIVEFHGVFTFSLSHSLRLLSFIQYFRFPCSKIHKP